MQKAMLVGLGLMLLGGCGDDSPPHQAKNDAHDIAMVERMNRTPFRAVRPQPFTDDDMAQYDLARGGCMFRPGNKPDEPPLFVAQPDRGYLKLSGKLQPVSVKSGSAELPSGAHSTYIGLEGWIELVAQAGAEGQGPDGKQAWPSRLVIHDADQRVAFDSLGQVSCIGDLAPEAKSSE